MIDYILDGKTVGFFFSQNRFSVAEESHARSTRVLQARRACRREKKKRIFSVSPQYRSLFSASLQAFCLTVCAYLNTQKYGLFCSLIITWYLFYGENSS